jgi:hypothetical protein
VNIVRSVQAAAAEMRESATSGVGR